MLKSACTLAVAALSFASPLSALAQSQADVSTKIESSLPTNGRGQITGANIRDVFNALNSARGKPNGIAELGSDGLLAPGQIPALAIGDQALGSVANKLPGIPAGSNLINALQDVVAFYAYGGKADATVHPLSGVSSINSTNTNGWTLSQWQSFYSSCNDGNGKSPVTALTNELDEIAIQCVINRKTDAAALWLPAGTMYQTKPILSGRAGLDVRGLAGPVATRIVQRVAGQDGWHHGTPDTGYPQVYYSQLSMQGVQMLCGQANGTRAQPLICGTALKVSFGPGTAGFTLQDFGVGAFGDQAANYWFNGINCDGCSLTQMSRVTIGGGNTIAGTVDLNSLGTGIAFTGNHAVQFILRDVTTNYWKTGISTQSGGNQVPGGTDLEGFIFDNWQANQVMDALVTQNSIGNGFLSPQYYIVNSQFNVCRRLFYMAQVSEVFIGNNLVYGCTAGIQTGGTADYTQFVGQVTGSGSAGSATITLSAAAPSALKVGIPFFGANVPNDTKVASVSGSTVTLSNALTGAAAGATFTYGAGSSGFNAAEYMIFNNVQRLTLRDNTFALGSSANISQFGRFLNVSDGTIANNKVQFVFNNSMNVGWYNDTGNTRLVERDSAFVGAAAWFNPVAGGTNGVANGNRFESFYNQFSTVVRSDKSLQYEGSTVVTLDANKNATLFIPPTFTAVPYSIQITNGGMDANPAYCGVNFANTSLSGVGISCPSSSAGAPARINYTLVGKQ